jgi:acyl carrier protein
MGIPGLLFVGGKGVGLGYLIRAELTAERFLPDPRGNGRRLYRTGDVGRWREDGRLEYLGRNDHQVQVRGFRVELGEVEAAFLAQAKIEQAVVLPLEETPGQVELVAYLVGERRNASELRTALAGRLPQYMIPGYIEWLPAIPLTANGKIDRKALPRPGGGAVSADAVAPRDATEAALLAMWREVLGIETIGIHDNFFDLGGHSLKAVRLRAKIEDGLTISISLRDLFAHATIAGLAALVGQLGAKAAPATGEAAELADLMAELSPEELEAQLDKLER